MGQSQSTQRPNTNDDAHAAEPTDRTRLRSRLPSSVVTTEATDAPADAVTAGAQASTSRMLHESQVMPNLPAVSSARSMSTRFSTLSLRSRRRPNATPDTEEAATATPKRSWLARMRSRTTSRSTLPNEQLPHSSSQDDDQITTPPEPPLAASAIPTLVIEPLVEAAEPPAAPESARTTDQPERAPTPTPAGEQHPGSLIIVQGIVQTQDTTATTSSEPAPASGSAASNGSRFFNRRNRNSYQSDSASLSPSTPSDASAPGTAAAADAPSSTTTPSDPDPGPSRMSQSSIDVLGTLLSFATAATAASLVTGSISPLFNSGLSPASGSNPLGDGGEPRQRSVLSTMRERLRNRRRDGETPSREQMLGELSRAISQGLEVGEPTQGQDSAANVPNPSSLDVPLQSGSTTPVPSPPSATPLSDQPPTPTIRSRPSSWARPPSRSTLTERSPTHIPALPASPHPQSLRSTPRPGTTPRGGLRANAPEGSFERFLHSLQADLRRALAEDYAAPARPSRSGSATPLSSNDSSDSTGNSTTPTTPEAERPAPAPAADGTEGEGPNRNGQVNWWRLYRFPPTRIPAGATMADGAAAEGATAPAANASNSTPPASASTGSATGTTNGSTPPIAQERPLVVPVIVVGLQSVTPADLATAIPENVRQEIENAMSGQRNGNAAASGTGQSSSAADQSGRRSRTSRVLHRLSNLPPWRTPPADPASESSALPEDSSESASLPAPERPPTPAPPSMTGGSSSSTTSPSATQPGRTFLIYVIGGYFSPQHSLVTGNLESLNSFEALWQLADLLGQVKPPVATKDDIEKSGLEVFKAASLVDYHEVGKVKENTMERCLICLEDYEAEDDLRLLSCSHAFHQACVDQWLEQGKNNCPACRTKGVLVQSDREEAVPSSSTTESSTAAPTAAPSTT